ncbi:MAG TPA: rhodanese-like domain-containing protein [Vicinamibacteria bacterium]|nr:rhodanese-like domain-containing protein [Vicinamibacteria bacterium]
MPTPPFTIDSGPRTYQDVSPEEAEELLALGAVALDVRTPREHEELGHIPGALLLPLELLHSAPAILPQDGRPVLVVGEHGSRSRRAAALLAEAGFAACSMTGGMSRWTGPRVHEPSSVAGPSLWLLSNVSLAPRGARTLDVACGRGRHALLLAGAGYAVRAVDRDAAQVAWLGALARRLRLPLDAAVVDLEVAGADLGTDEWELVLVFNYLHRPLFPALVRSLKTGGVLLYETYTREQAKRGKPTCPDHLLEPGELPRLVAPLEVVRQREGDYEGRALASVVARKTARRHAARVAARPRDPAPKRAARASRGKGRRTR